MNLNPLRLFTASELHWFDRNPDDRAYLDRWADTPLTYTLDQPTDATWHTDHYEHTLFSDSTGDRFRRAADRLLRYDFYPASVMHHVSTFARENRRMQVGDRIVQRIHVVRLFGLPVIDVVTMNALVDVVDMPHRAAFTYVTTEQHSEEGAWSAWLDWRESGAVVLTVDALSRARRREPALIRPFMRWLQHRAHRLGIAAFRQATAIAGSGSP